MVTNTENAALLLEYNLIKEHRPKYNILFRDDKSYPYIALSADKYPRLSLHRGAKKPHEEYFGPYPSTRAVYETLNLLQKLFLLRPCKNTYFKSRTRPCLQYQIKRCSAPCVQFIDEQSYQRDVQYARLFLQGKNQDIVEKLQVQMETAANNLQYELALRYREQIKTLREIQHQQIVDIKSSNMDVLAVVTKLDTACIQWLMIRQGRVIGSKSFLTHALLDGDSMEILRAFIMQHYMNDMHTIPQYILLNTKLTDAKLLQAMLTQKANHKVTIQTNARTDKAQLLNMAMSSARQALASHVQPIITIKKSASANCIKCAVRNKAN